MEIALILKSPELNETVTQSTVIYADAGYLHAPKVGQKEVLAVIGDFDSLGCAPKGENIVNLSPEKDFTDGERALRYAVEKGYNDVTIYGAYGGKIEHVLGNIALLNIAKNLGAKARIKEGERITELIDGKVKIMPKNNSTVSILPYGGSCSFVKSIGLYYPLDNLTLTPYDTRGISNVALQEEIAIEFRSGKALIVYEQK